MLGCAAAPVSMSGPGRVEPWSALSLTPASKRAAVARVAASGDEMPDEQHDDRPDDGADQTCALIGPIPADRLTEVGRDERADDAENGRKRACVRAGGERPRSPRVHRQTKPADQTAGAIPYGRSIDGTRVGGEPNLSWTERGVSLALGLGIAAAGVQPR